MLTNWRHLFMCVYVHFGQLTELRHGILKLLRIHEHRDPGNYLV